MGLEDRLAAALADRYTFEGEIGRGGTASVFLAEDRKHHRKVAIKVLDPTLTEALGPQRFLREIRTAAGLTHPHILPLHDSGEAEGLLFYTMPYIRGESLRKRLEREGQLPLEDAIGITLEMARALSFAHEEGLVHRDVKPGNILLESDHAVLADFGLAQALASAEGYDLKLTRVGTSVGSPAYMSPEQATGQENLDGRTDQFSLACVLYEMLVGEPAFTGATPQALLAQKLSGPQDSPRFHRSTVSEDLEAVLQRALEWAPADRFPSMGDFANALQAAAFQEGGIHVSGGSPRHSIPRTKEERPGLRSRVWAATGALAVGAALVGAWAAGWLGGGSPPRDGDYPRSMVVLPFHPTSGSPEEAAAAVEVADLLARDLDWWDSIRAMGSAALTGVIHDAGISDATFQSSEVAVDIAKAADAEAVLAVSVHFHGDSAAVQGTIYDASTGRLGPWRAEAQGPRTALARFATPLAFSLLDIEEGVPAPRDHGTTDLAAFRAFLQGRERFFDNNFQGAQDGFREAVGRDSTYAPALTWLALSMYWTAIEGGRRLDGVRSDMARLSTHAQEYLPGLSGADSLHVAAFFDFQRGDYDGGRRGYERLLGTSPGDLAGWLMAGELEIRDRWLVPDSSGSMRPRANLNLALEAFQRTTEIRPTFEVGYSRTFDVAGDLESAVRTRSCSLFQVLRPEYIPPGEVGGIENAQAFCPAYRDSIRWIPKGVFDSMDPVDLALGTSQVFDRAVQMLEAWEVFAPEATRPKELISEVLIRRRSSRGPTSPQVLMRETERVLGYAEVALSSKGDTTPTDLFLIANLLWASGRTEEGVDLAQAAMAQHEAVPDSIRGRLPLEAANVFMASGQLEPALRIVREHGGRRFVGDPASGDRIAYAGAEPVVWALAVLGAGGVRGEAVQRELARLDSLWDEAGYSPHQQQVLRNASSIRIGTALVQNPAAYQRWGSTVDLDQYLWARLGLPGDGSASDQDYLDALEAETTVIDDPPKAFLIASKARASGAGAVAQRVFSRLDSLPHGVASFDAGWGLTAISRIQIAEILEEHGDYGAAIEALEEFKSIWQEADALGRLTMDRVEAQIQRLLAQLGGESPDDPREQPMATSL